MGNSLFGFNFRTKIGCITIWRSWFSFSSALCSAFCSFLVQDQWVQMCHFLWHLSFGMLKMANTYYASWGLSTRVCVCMLSHSSHVWLLVTPWTLAHQAPLSMQFSRQEYWSVLSFPTPAYLPDPEIKPVSLGLLHRQEDSLPLHHWGSP